MCNRHENGMKNKIKTGRYFPSHSMWHVTHNIVLERRRHVEQSVVPIKDEKQQLRSKFFPVSLHLFSRTEMKTWKHCFCTPAFSCTKYTYDERTWPVHTYSWKSMNERQLDWVLYAYMRVTSFDDGSIRNKVQTVTITAYI